MRRTIRRTTRRTTRLTPTRLATAFLAPVLMASAIAAGAPVASAAPALAEDSPRGSIHEDASRQAAAEYRRNAQRERDALEDELRRERRDREDGRQRAEAAMARAQEENAEYFAVRRVGAGGLLSWGVEVGFEVCMQRKVG